MKIIVNNQMLDDSIKFLEETESLIIDGNLFNIKSIKTIFKVEENKFIDEDINFNFLKADEFKFSYNDSLFKDFISIEIFNEDVTCLSFLVERKLIDKNNLDIILDKARAMLFKTNIEHDVPMTKLEYYKAFNEIIYNEALIFISSGINKDDKETEIESFKLKFDEYNKKNCENNYKKHLLISHLADKLISIKKYEEND